MPTPDFDLAAAIAADPRPGQFFVRERLVDDVPTTLRLHEADLTADERAAVGLPPLPEPEPEPLTPPDEV